MTSPITNNANLLQTNLLQTRVFIHFYNSGCSWGAGGRGRGREEEASSWIDNRNRCWGEFGARPHQRPHHVCLHTEESQSRESLIRTHTAFMAFMLSSCYRMQPPLLMLCCALGIHRGGRCTDRSKPRTVISGHVMCCGHGSVQWQ